MRKVKIIQSHKLSEATWHRTGELVVTQTQICELGAWANWSRNRPIQEVSSEVEGDQGLAGGEEGVSHRPTQSIVRKVDNCEAAIACKERGQGATQLVVAHVQLAQHGERCEFRVNAPS